MRAGASRLTSVNRPMAIPFTVDLRVVNPNLRDRLHPPREEVQPLAQGEAQPQAQGEAQAEVEASAFSLFAKPQFRCVAMVKWRRTGLGKNGRHFATWTKIPKKKRT
jgi:hypothetical protein